MRRAGVLGIGAFLAALTACAMPGKRGPGISTATDESADTETRKAELRSRWTVPDWEAWQKRHARALAQLSTPAAPGPAPNEPTPGPARRPVARPRPTPPPTEDVPQSGAGGSANPADQQTLRCRRICRHVRAICHAAVRICRIAQRLNEPPAEQACRRSQARCTDARAVAGRTCPPCGITGGRPRCTRRRFARRARDRLAR